MQCRASFKDERFGATLLIHSEMYESLMSPDLFMVKNDCM
jgi:hypothetical protein